eukprot:gnl/TRDRNA2_/TRDRNA2_91371_c0_seq1.p1 gnl/TRDRNA2_/TRDRNA2_91371_c0~~gnl/TRDRNA2_/TRDRNA2_91371_c0_seq1.p1  ORF type:complete len:320 (-),score=76.00 gnl/TRDRNA2_/TRDRNA2_91371_c0_seq1:82-1041(-)
MGCNSSAAKSAAEPSAKKPLKGKTATEKAEPEADVDALLGPGAALATSSSGPSGSGQGPRARNQERAKAAAEDDQGGATGGDEEFFQSLLGERAGAAKGLRSSPSVAPPAGAAAAVNGSGGGGPAKKSPPGPKTEEQKRQIALRAARMGVPVPDDDEEQYDIMDDYVDNLLGTPLQDRPSDWKAPTLAESQARLQQRVPEIIYGDGRKGPSMEPPPKTEALLGNLSQQELDAATTEGALHGLAKDTYMGTLVTNWGSIDHRRLEARSENAEAAARTVVVQDGAGPAPKRKANRPSPPTADRQPSPSAGLSSREQRGGGR